MMVPRLSVGPAAAWGEVAPGAFPAEQWETNDGPPVCGWRDGQSTHLFFPGLGRYSFDAVAGDCSARPLCGAAYDRVVDAYERSVLPILFHARGGEALHASAVVTRGGVVAFAARSGTGKSTLAAEFLRRGFEAWADDAVAWSPAEPKPAAMALPFALRPKGSNSVVRGGFVPGTLKPLDAVVVVERSALVQETRVERVHEAARSLELLLPHAYCFAVKEMDSARRTMSDYLSLIGQVGVYRLLLKSDVQHVGVAVDLVCAALGLGADSHSESRAL